MGTEEMLESRRSIVLKLCRHIRQNNYQMIKAKNYSERPYCDGEKIYHADRIIRETGKEFKDGTHIIYVNGAYKSEEGKPLDDLIHDFFCANPEEMRHNQLAKRVKFLKENKGGVHEMSNVISEFFKDEIAEAEKKKLLENIRALMETMKWSAQQAMDALKIPANEQNKYLSLISK